MNRRNYLKQMALGAAGIAGAKLEVFGQRSRSSKAPKVRRDKGAREVTIGALAENFQRWPGTQVPIANPPVLVTLEGLLDLYYNVGGPNDKTCGVGFHRGGGHHVPTYEVREIGDTSPARPIRISNNSEVILGVVNAADQDKAAMVEFLKNNSTEDLRWLIDMQSQSWYPGTVTQGNYSVRLFIRHGTFSTKVHTQFELNQAVATNLPAFPYLVTGSLGKPANVIGDAISLGTGEKVLLRVNRGIVTIPQDPTKRYLVRFTNSCPHDNPACEFCWSDPHEEKRNDFHHHRGTLVPKPFSLPYSVVLKPNQGQLPCREKMASTNEAPCMPAGYGDGNGPS